MKIEERTREAAADVRRAWEAAEFTVQSPQAPPRRIAGLRVAVAAAALVVLVFAVPLVAILIGANNDVANDRYEIPVELEEGFEWFEGTYGISVDPVRRLIEDGDFTLEEYEPLAHAVVDCVEATGVADAETNYVETDLDSGFEFTVRLHDGTDLAKWEGSTPVDGDGVYESSEVNDGLTVCERTSLFEPATWAWLTINYASLEVADGR